MGLLSFSDVLASLVTSMLGAVGNLLCAPLYDKIKTSLDVLNAPESFSEDVKKLSNVMNHIKAMRSSDQIDIWLSEAEKIMQTVALVLLNLNRSSSQNDDLQLSCCTFGGHGVMRCKLHKKVRKLTIQGQNIITCANLSMERVEHIPGVPNIEDGSTAEKNLKQVMDMLNNDEVCSIGVWGPGGVGKTTLVNALNNKLESTSSCSFSLVILIPLIKDVNENTVQKAIAKKLKLDVKEGMDTREIANQIYNRLQREKFLLILDNAWESIDLLSIGIPENQKGSKVMLTTRLEKVCIMMKAKAIKIGYPTATEAWELFVEKAGEVVNDPRIRTLAKAVCRECGDLPLALVTVGSAMRGKNNVHQWQSAINDMKSSNPPDGVETQVYKLLKLSFDFLANDTLKSCFLYCSLYPEGYLIPVSELVQCWLAENIIDEQLNYDGAYSKGLDLIENLKNSSLLEGTSVDSVKMHDVVRDVAIWIGKLNGTSIVFSGHGISKRPRVALPKEIENVKWISIVDNKEIQLPKYHKSFPKVTTLLLFGTREQQVQVSEEFLRGFPVLRVLNVRKLQSFSFSHGQLTELRVLLLRNCISEMKKLLYAAAKLMVVDVSCPSIYRFTVYDIRWQATLRVLNLSDTRNLKIIEAALVRGLSALEVLDMRGSGYKWPTMRDRRSMYDNAVLQDLSELMSLKEVYLVLADVKPTYVAFSWMKRLKSFQFHCGFNSLHRPTQEKKRIHIEGTEVNSFILHAEILILEGILGNVNEIFANFRSNTLFSSELRSLEIINCSFSEELAGYDPDHSALPYLESLRLYLNEQVRSFYQIGDALRTAFPKLRRLDIFRQLDLENVFSSGYPHIVLPELEEIVIYGCENLTEVFHGSPTKIQVLVPKLKCLTLDDLKSLRNLCNCELSENWQSLEVLSVNRCPNLKKLPPMTSIKQIRGTEEWWNNLEWDNPENKSYMNQFFRPLDYEVRGLQLLRSLFGLDISK